MKSADRLAIAAEIIGRTDDDILIAFATTCSSRAVALAAEVALRKRYPSSKAVRKIAAEKRKGRKRADPP